ncbi:MAG TPA: hypothetical protein VJT13_01620 [Xanthobacteraceae bacterium]|nr:hypothetical protein [Xanthobacteraceae bacterium]
MFDDPRDINRDLGTNPYRDRGAMMGEGSGWGVPLALLAIVVIIAGLIAFAPTTNQQTAANQPAIERSTPPASPAPTTPPATTPAPKQ